MAIEPISSLMTVQAQGSAVTQKPQTPVETERPDSSTSSAPAAELVDRTTAVVENAQEKGNANSNDQGKEQQQLSHEDTNRVTIKIVDKNTKEVIKELPPEKTLDMIAKVWEMAGILIDERR